jgi:hypothetical protein
MRDGKRKKMFYCSRLDCDNWMSKSVSHEQDIGIDKAA